MIRLRTWNLFEGGLSIFFTLGLLYRGFQDSTTTIILLLGLLSGVFFGAYGARRIERILEKNREWLPSVKVRLLGPMATVLFIIGLFLLPPPAALVVSSVFLPLALLSFGTALLSQIVFYRRWEKSNQKLILMDWQSWKSRIVAVPKGGSYSGGTVFSSPRD